MALIHKETRFLGEDGRMYHFCKKCNGYKPADEFNKCSKCPFGLYPLCKEHHREQNRKQYKKVNKEKPTKNTENDMSYLKLTFPKESDYVFMRELLEKLGYDTSRNIHQQFMERLNKKIDKNK
jgi:hypothetical protein